MDAVGRKQDAGKRRRNLVLTMATALREAIQRGDYSIGDKLPSEAELTASHAVSRTVVREAVAALRSEGLVEARQGAGVFVTANRPATSTPFQGIDPEKLSSIIEILELRTAVEIEAAGLAAVRRSPAQEEAIYQRLSDIDACVEAGETTTEADFAFHLAIADATNNPRFREFLAMLGGDAIPRRRLQTDRRETVDSAYLEMLQAEHRAVADAIAEGDDERARQAMRTHLLGGQARYKRMLRMS
ncbi:GntR family transcriptional regulator [Zhengella mangrovi]|uniref:GntR family transcriptional regulator n=1 Tax=Zhengella mangrovi TaxID=1982044 RepID=A0A2G1QLB6_9HYPH|nr:FadR/GntR family transcriptional regulator [Zhengella mangrovi]PHP66008.1 GntR family transcriptional regulator [Zhengella mangrovi]